MSREDSFREREDLSVFESDHEIIIVGIPDEDDESHNCDAMGCNSLNHVLYRIQKEAVK